MAGLANEEKRKHNELMHILSHQMPEFSQVLAAGAEIGEENKNFFYKRVSGKRDSVRLRVRSLWSNLTGATEATFRYDLFLDRNPNFPAFFQTIAFKNAFTFTVHQNNGRSLLGHQQSPEMYYMYSEQNYVLKKVNEFKRANPGSTKAEQDKEYMRVKSTFSSENERQFFNEVINALTKPLPEIYANAIDAVTKGAYSAKQNNQKGGKTRRHRHRR
jgi:hypothetical protein